MNQHALLTSTAIPFDLTVFQTAVDSAQRSTALNFAPRSSLARCMSGTGGVRQSQSSKQV
jgi:hypothetical protein